MSKNKKKDANAKADVPIDFQVESKNLQYTITLKDQEIDLLQKENQHKKEYINKLEEEKRQIEQNFQDEIQQLKVVIESSKQKVEMANQLTAENQELLKQVDTLKTNNENIIKKHITENKTKDVKNEIKFTNLKKKMKEKIDQIQAKETELNVQYMDVSTKLTLLQNHQLLIQLEYQSQQLDEINAKKEELEKRLFELTKDIEIHKEVELSLAEKNKKLKNENNKLKGITEDNTNNNISNDSKNPNNKRKSVGKYKTHNLKINIADDEKISENNHQNINTSSFKNLSTVENNTSINNFNNLSNVNTFNSNAYTRMMNLEKKVLNLEKKLMASKKDYNSIKDRNEYVEKILKNYERKYSGLFNFFEDCLEQFFNDEELVNNQEIFVNIDNIRKCDFSNLNKEEKYTTLIIMMKYLMPLMDSSNAIKQNQNNNSINNVNLKFYLGNNKNYPKDSDAGLIPGRKNSFGKMSNSMDNTNKKENILPNINNINYAK